MFKANFDPMVIPGEYIACESEGFAIIATLAHDDMTTAPEDHPQRESWLEDDWHYFGIALAVWKAGVCLTKAHAHAQWGIEGNCPGDDNHYFTDVANDLLPDAVAAAKAKLVELCKI